MYKQPFRSSVDSGRGARSWFAYVNLAKVKSSLFFLVCIFYSTCSYGLLCDDLEVVGEIIGKHRENNQIVTRTYWLNFPSIYSIHSGEFHGLKVSVGSDFSELELRYVSTAGSQWQQQLVIDEGRVVNFDFIVWEESFEAEFPGKIIWKFKGPDGTCTLETRVIEGG